MNTSKKIILTIFLFLLNSCVVTRVNSKTLSPPTKSFVKVMHTINIISCSDPKDKNCPTGERYSLGSGMAVNIYNNTMVVLTAGHVCDARPTGAVKEYVQTLQVLDHKKQIHQAWPITLEHIDGNGKIDICLLWVPTLKVKKIKISKIIPKVGEELYYVGAPTGVYHPPTVPIFKGIYSGEMDNSSSIVTVPAAGGASGAPVLNLNNEIVGIIWGVKIDFNNISLMTNPRSFNAFIKHTQKKYILP